MLYVCVRVRTYACSYEVHINCTFVYACVRMLVRKRYIYCTFVYADICEICTKSIIQTNNKIVCCAILYHDICLQFCLVFFIEYNTNINSFSSYIKNLELKSEYKVLKNEF